MEFKEYIEIFRKQAALFAIIVLFSTVAAVFWQRNQPQSYQASLLLNIGRSGSQTTSDYAYDSFYRLQADERFADTVVRWLASPRIAEDIYADARLSTGALDLQDLKSLFRAGRMSSQMIDVSYGGESERVLKQLSQSIITVLNRYADSLNRENASQSWFVIIGNEPVIRDARVSLPVSAAIGFVGGSFIGFWLILFRHYFGRK